MSDKSHIGAKLFVGCLMNGELRMHLNGSELWKQAKLQLKGTETTLTQTHFEQHDYIGIFSAKNPLTVEELRTLETTLRSQLHLYCPKLDVAKIKLNLFTQLFIS